jgi:hypothetical protein
MRPKRQYGDVGRAVGESVVHRGVALKVEECPWYTCGNDAPPPYRGTDKHTVENVVRGRQLTTRVMP